MARVRLIPGASGATTARGLVLYDGDVLPQVTLQDPGTAVALVRSDSSALDVGLHGVRLATYRLAGLKPGQAYRLVATLGGAPATEATFATLEPEATTLRVVFASCFYEYFHRGWGYAAALEGRYAEEAAFKLLAGDNLYMDIHPQQRSFKDGVLETAHLYLEYLWRSNAYAAVLSRGANVTTWDDHEFWNNYPEDVKFLTRTRAGAYARYRDAGRAAVDLFQACLNPPSASPGGRSYLLTEGPLVDWCVVDLRTDRTRMDDGGRMAPAGTARAVRAWARALRRPGVLVLGQPLILKPGTRVVDYTPANYPDEFEDLWRALEEAPFDVLLLSGDVHHSRATRFTLPNGRHVDEVISSPASHIPTTFTTVTGSLSSQGRGTVAFPTSVRYGGADARIDALYFGTDAPNTIAVLDFKAAGGSTVGVGVTFLDLDHSDGPQPAPSVREMDGWKAIHAVCQSPNLFELKAR